MIPTSARPSARLRGDRLGWFALVVVGIVVVLSVVRAFVPMPYLGDMWRPADTATIAHNFFVGGMRLFDPQINWGGAGPGYVEAELQLLPWLSATVYFVFGEHAWVGRLVSLAFTIIGLTAFWALARRVLPGPTARWALIAYVVSPMVMTYGNAFMPDVTVLAFYLLTLLFFHKWLTDDRGVWLVAAASAASMAALAKPTSLHVFLILLIWLLISARDRLRRPSLYIAGVAALIAPALWLWHAHELYVQYGNTFGVISGGDSKFGNLAIWTSSLFYTGNISIEATLVYGLVGVPLALVGAWLAWRGRGPVILAAGFPALIVFYFAVARYSSELGPQYHIFSLPFAAILVGIGVQGISSWLRGRVPALVRGGLAVATVALLFAQSLIIFVQSFQDNSGVYGVCSAELAQVSAPSDLVVISTTSNAIDRGTANNFQEPTIFYLADRKGWSLAADQHQPSYLESYAKQGAKYFVVYAPLLVPAGSELADWLDTNAKQVRSAADDGCAIWALDPPGAV
ncbi:glycosyltransferase family 39 protein [Pseudonocardia sp. GCM10023141]|uniref:glycosyltransferase family 39 protein n=1 Tax=Pseudonocardia sp. GCM10023141 TaxID=3252653 RepID=UPI003618854B